MKKKLLTLLISCACAIGAIGFVACKGSDKDKRPSNSIENGLKFEYISFNDHEGYVIRNVGGETLTDVEIPAKHNGHPVISVGFSDCDSLTSILIPDGVIMVSFSDCDGLTSITLPDSVTKIAFSGCDSLTDVTMGNGVTEIDGSTFKDCTALTSIVIPDSVISIRDRAFECCDSLESVTVGSSVTEIGSACFNGCTSLTSITIPRSVTKIGVSAFSGCESLAKVNYTGTIDEWATLEWGGNNSNPLRYAKKLYINDVEVTEAVITTATRIRYSAFEGWESLTSVTIGDSVTSIGHAAFADCIGLTGDLVIPDSVTSIGERAFFGTNFSNIVVGNGVSSLGGLSFGDNLKTIKIGNGITKIEDRAFGDCSSLTSVTLPDSVTSIGYYAFGGCSSLTDITLPDSVSSIGSRAFEDCSSLTSITIPDSVTSMASNAFAECDSLREATIGNGLTKIEGGAFAGCISLTSVTIGREVTSIGNSAFEVCYKLVEVINKSSLTITAGASDNGCVGVYAKQVITDETESKLVWFDDYALYREGETLSLVAYYGKEAEVVLPDTMDGSTYTLDRAFWWNSTITSVTIPDGVTSIGKQAFYCCSSLTSVTIGSGVTSIGDLAFYYCSSLTSVTIGSGVTSIGEQAFYYCSSLTKVNYTDTIDRWAAIDFYNAVSNPLYYAGKLYVNDVEVTKATLTAVTEIGKYAFYNCNGLTSVTIGREVTSIDNSAFEGCYKFVEVINYSSLTITAGKTVNGYVGAYAKQVMTNAADSKLAMQEDYLVYKDGENSALVAYYGTNAEIVLPDDIDGNGYAIYQYAFYNRSGLTSITIPDGVTSIGSGAFMDCTNLIETVDGIQYVNAWVIDCDNTISTVTIREGTKGIAASAFYNCRSLTSITIPDSVTSIGNYAFSNCDSLTSITIPDSVISIGSFAFNGCYGLAKVNYAGTIDEWVMIDFYDYTANPLYYAKKLYINDVEVTEVTLTTATKIEDYALRGGSSITNIIISDSVTSIGDQAFYYCSSLTSITIGNGVTSIGVGAFGNCGSLTTVYYAGTKAQWDLISIENGNSVLTYVTIRYSEEAHSCSYQAKTDDTYHWTECDCGKTTEKVAHSYGAWQQNEETHWKECDCGYSTGKVAHSYGAWQQNEETHWKECDCGYSTEKVAHSYGNDNVCDDCGRSLAAYTRIDEQGNVSDTGSYILFGSYPQSKVTDGTVTGALNESAGALPTDGNDGKWISYEYYIESSNEVDYTWYQDVAYGGDTYRGVYFSSYRPEYTDYDSSADKSYQDDNGYTVGTVYWFKYEPIKWKILEEENGYATVLCEMVIDSQEYYPVDGSRTVDGQTVYSTNYEYSAIRAWLNETFYQTAFSELEQALIQTVTVDNGVESTGETTNDYVCADTQDKIWLLSYKEATTYFSDAEERPKIATDYAQCQGLLSSDDDKGDGWYTWGCWWLRSPIKDTQIGGYFMGYTMNVVWDDGTFSVPVYANDTARAGVCPALKIKLN